MDQRENRTKKTASQTRKPVSRKKPTKHKVSSSRPRTATGEPLSRDELRSLRNYERRKKHRRNQLILYAIAIVVVIIAAVVLSLTVFFKISDIAIAGDEIYSKSEIVSASHLKKGDNMFTFSKTDVASDIERTLPYVESVEIKRSPTGKITFNIVAAKATLAIDLGDSYILLSDNCKVLEDDAQAINEDATLIKSSEIKTAKTGDFAEFENENDAQTISKIANFITENGIQNITEIDVTDYTDLKLGYSQRITLKIGSLASLEKKVEFIKATLEKIDADEPYFSGVIDFTIENKAFINDNVIEDTTKPDTEPQTDENGEPITKENGAENSEETTKKSDESETKKNSEN